MTLLAAESEVVLRDGSTVHVRPIAPGDRDGMRVFLGSLSDNSRRLRYFSGGADTDLAAQSAVEVSYPESYGIVATRGNARIVAHATYVTATEARAEVAFAVADELHGLGIATTLLAHLAQAAEEAGVHWFEADVMPENHRMVEVFRESGFTVRAHSEPDAIHLEFPTTLGPGAHRRFAERDSAATTAAVRSFLAPSSVAVVGASRRPGTVGHETLHNMLAAGYTGRVYAVNPRARSIFSLPAFRSVADLPEPVELAVIAVPAAAVVETARQCAEKGVRALVVLSAGFGESGAEGAKRQRELVQVCRQSGMRLVGPNCMGVLNTDPDVRLNATFAPSIPPAGRVGLLSQSGAVGLAVLDHAQALGLGLSSFVSVGNKSDISGNDLLQYWEQDDATELIVLCLESFGNPRKFARLARRVGARKPILAVKSDVTVDALFRQAGVIRTDTLSELFDVAKLLDAQPVPRGGRVGIVTNSGEPAIMCADACEANGLEVPDLPEALQAELMTFLPPAASTSNPVEMTATASAESYRLSIEAIAASGAVEAIVAIFIPPPPTGAEDVAQAICDAALKIDRSLPLVSVFASHEPAPARLAAARVPSYSHSDDAARALAKAADHGRWLGRDPGAIPMFDGLRRDEAAATIANGLSRGTGWLEPPEVATLLSCYGIAMNRRMASTGVEMLVRVIHDPLFGPVVACGSGGTGAEALGDVSVCLTPMSDHDARDMVRSLRSYPLLSGHRDAEPVDVDALEDAVLRLAAMVDEHAEIVEADMNPVIVSAEGAVVVDARVRVEERPPTRLWPSVGT
jgi:acyl-CoA synthetase (NDP forming)/GNAT superfamily N-acetyltransferase